MAKVRWTKASLAEAFREQMDFLETSAELYDQGKTSEAKRMAVVLRVLFRHYGNSHALLAQMGFLDDLKLLDTADLDSTVLRAGAMNIRLEVETADGERLFAKTRQDGLVEVVNQMGRPTFVPPLAARRGSSRMLRFDPWWTGAVMDFPNNERFSRWNLVNMMANQDGGAHVDPKGIGSAYAAFRRTGHGSVWSNSGDVAALSLPDAQYFEGDPSAASMRQIAYEVVTSLSENARLQEWVRSPL
ncbi:hypothetical protein FBY30_2734 [Arthrobacter sp. SLBN-83]|uniref:hypothetical protein n=1 Tax=Arthrobacter sp. SLBN-83 TaxID=2768449 RepID=UPI0011517539|nr:hypothetical protein [Arthrobacter sp. SLBN-83]TQJ60466.1 hypothetical protein FBY30_2734 [Arthrobacter sp. SLBN-83]